MSDVQLYHGDCLEIMPTLPAHSVQMVFADLPYGILKNHAWDSSLCLPSFWKVCVHVLLDQAPAILTGTMRFAQTLIASNEKAFFYDLVFEKKLCSSPFHAKRRPLSVHEHVLIFNKTKQYNPQMRDENERIDRREREWAGNTGYNRFFGRQNKNKKRMKGPMFPRSVLKGMCESKNTLIHPTQKPVALLEYLIRSYTNEGDTILDPVAGSGTTAIAAMRVGNRKVICIEKDRTYFVAMSKRVEGERARMMQASLAI